MRSAGSRRRLAAGVLAPLTVAATLASGVGVAAARSDAPPQGRAGKVAVAPLAVTLSSQAADWHREWGVFRPSDSLGWPVHGEITGYFGEPRGGHMHEGLDVPLPKGAPIRAAGDGRVVMREDESGYGKYTCIAHVTISTCYAHQSRFAVKRGARVARGQVIGFVGDTGRAYAMHLHFEVRRGTRPWGKPLSPMKHLPRARR